MCTLKKKVVLVGDSGCGKSALAIKLCENMFLDIYEPTGFDNFMAEIRTAKGNCSLTILDTSGCGHYSNIRSLAYRGCDAVIVCFDLTDKASLTNVEKIWLPELKANCPSVPLYIAGCKRDAMCEIEKGCSCGGNCCTQDEQALLQIIERTGAVAYTECSSAMDADDGVEGLFQVVVETSTQKKNFGAKKMISKLKKQSKNIKRRFSILSQ